MSAPQRLEKSQWPMFCDVFSRELEGKRAELEVASPEHGVRIDTRELPVIGLAYDLKSGLFVIILDDIEHLVFRPRELYVEYGIGGVASFGILDQNSTWQIVMLHDPPMLPRAS
jgi:hypothetical protein